jgi:hypothetical protein
MQLLWFGASTWLQVSTMEVFLGEHLKLCFRSHDKLSRDGIGENQRRDI